MVIALSAWNAIWSEIKVVITNSHERLCTFRPLSGHILPFRQFASSQVQCLAKNLKLQKFMYQDNYYRGQSEKEIYQTGSLRLVSMAIILKSDKISCMYYQLYVFINIQ